jgi:hypothetical protein
MKLQDTQNFQDLRADIEVLFGKKATEQLNDEEENLVENLREKLILTNDIDVEGERENALIRVIHFLFNYHDERSLKAEETSTYRNLRANVMRKYANGENRAHRNREAPLDQTTTEEMTADEYIRRFEEELKQLDNSSERENEQQY